MEIDFSQAVSVAGVAQEYGLVASQRCECGGRWRITLQRLLFHADRPYDLLEAVCPQCGRQRRFLFDIGSFFGRYPL